MLVSKWVWLFQVGVIFRFLAFAEAEPTENELNIHSKVAAILVKAPEILASLQAYKGAGELIREVRRYSDVLCGCGFKWFWGVVSFSCLLMPSFHLLSPFPHAFFPLPLLTPSPHPPLSPSQAISNASSAEHQDAAWQAVCPLVSLLKLFYEYAIELESALCQLLNCLCSPDFSALQHLEQEQVRPVFPVLSVVCLKEIAFWAVFRCLFCVFVCQ